MSRANHSHFYMFTLQQVKFDAASSKNEGEETTTSASSSSLLLLSNSNSSSNNSSGTTTTTKPTTPPMVMVRNMQGMSSMGKPKFPGGDLRSILMGYPSNQRTRQSSVSLSSSSSSATKSQANEFACTCPTGWTGATCEISKCVVFKPSPFSFSFVLNRFFF